MLRAPSGERETEKKRGSAHAVLWRSDRTASSPSSQHGVARRVPDESIRARRSSPSAAEARFPSFSFRQAFSSPSRDAHAHAGESSKVDASDRGRCQEPTRRRSRYDGRLLVARWYYAKSSYISRCRRRTFVSLCRARPRSARHPHRKLTLASFVSLHRAAKGVTRGFHRPNSINRQ